MRNTDLQPLPPDAIAQEAVARYGAMQKSAELAQLLGILQQRQQPANVLEIGGMRGGTAWAWAQLGADTVVIDKFVLEGRMERFRPQVLIEGDSHDASVAKQARRFGPFDLLFIDGDHSYHGVRRDFELYAPMVAPSGIIALHDVSVEQAAWVRLQHDVAPYWNQVRQFFEHQEIFDAEGEQWGGIGVMYVGPSINMEPILELGEPTDQERIATVMCDTDICHACGAKLVPGEEVFCRSCASAR